jgi:hypothetical protein
MFNWLVVRLLIFLSACSSLRPESSHMEMGQNHLAWVGAAPTSLPDFDEINDAALLF